MNEKRIVVLTGAGISAESGLKTFRDSNGLWEEYNIEEVATYSGWLRNPKLVLDFYNKRRGQLQGAVPNDAHIALAQLEKKYEVHVITQNVDDLHERGGSTNIIHLHGELTKVRSTKYPELVYNIGYKDINIGDLCENGEQLRPHIVWFGEAVPLMDDASKIVEEADYLLIIGTSLQVYPAAGLMHYAPSNCLIYLIDPKAENSFQSNNITVIRENAGTAVPKLVKELLDQVE